MSTARIGEIINLNYGKALAAKSRRPGKVPVFGSNGQTGWHDEPLIEEPTLIVGRKGSIGEVHYCDRPSHTIDTAYFVTQKPEKPSDLRYIFYVLRSLDLKRLNSATGIPGLNREDVYKQEIPLPPLEKQRRIVALLDRAAEIRRRAEAARDKARAIIPALFVDMFGDPATNPKGWDIVELGEIADISSGITKGRKLNDAIVFQAPYMRVANVQDGRLDLSDVKMIDAVERDLERYKLEEGDLLMTEGGDPDKLGRCAIWNNEIEDCLHQNHVFRVRVVRTQLLPAYAATLIGSAYGKSYFLKVAKRTTGIASINKTQLSAFPMLVPPIALQREFEKLAGASNHLENIVRSVGMKAANTQTALSAEVFA